MREAVSEVNPDALFCDGFDEAIIGTAERFGMPAVAAYDYDQYIALLVKGRMHRGRSGRVFRVQRNRSVGRRHHSRFHPAVTIKNHFLKSTKTSSYIT